MPGTEYCWPHWKTACVDAENSDVLGGLGTMKKKNRQIIFSQSLEYYRITLNYV